MSAARWSVLAAALAVPLAAVQAANLTITKVQTIVSDPVNTLNPKAVPGALIDYAITVANPLSNGILPVKTVANVAIADTVATGTVLRVADYGASGSGPVEFADGSLLGIGLVSSGVGYSFAGLASTADAVDFSTDGVNWTYVPVADAAGYDACVRAVRVRLSGTQNAGTSFRLRFRVRVS